MTYIQISSGRGPAECQRVVAKVLNKMLKQAEEWGLQTEVIEREEGEFNGTLLSVIFNLCGEREMEFVKEWEGTVLWIAQSPYRKFHKRKNWFVGIQKIEIPEMDIHSKEIVFHTFRASGPGGQHVNKTESAVRATHIASGISVTVSERRSQFQNKQMATERLLLKLNKWKNEEACKLTQDNWNNHNSLLRGNPVRTFEERL